MSRRAPFILTLGALFLAACEAGNIAIFSTEPASMGGASTDAGANAIAGAAPTDAAGMGGVTLTAGSGGAADSESGGGASGSAGALEPACDSKADCDPGYFCSKQRCEDAQGTCALSPFLDDAMDLQVCGCDGITYWNDTYRQAFGIAASTMGPCNSAARTCRGDQECGVPHDNYSCEHFLPPNAACGVPSIVGRCWVTPAACPQTSPDDKRYQVCSPPYGSGGGPSACVTKCEAIQSGRPFSQLSRDQVCPDATGG